jgi:hypothetical protein
LRGIVGFAVIAVAAGLLAGCDGPRPPRSALSLSADRDGLTLQIRVRATGDALVLETLLRNDRAAPVHLVSDQCGRVTEALLVRTTLEPEGETWTGSVQAAKDLILDDQLSRQSPDRFHPRVPGDMSTRIPDCVRPDRPVPLAPSDEIAERWELPFTAAYALDEVGSDGSAVRVEVVEAVAPDELEFLDVLPAGQADEAREGRSMRIERPASTLFNRAPRRPVAGPSLGELYDRLIENDELRGWIEAQPADGWRHVQLTPAYPEMGDPAFARVRLRLVASTYERAALVDAAPDGSGARVELPGPGDRTREFARRPGTLPPGISLIHEPEGYVLTDDLLLGEVRLPSGRVVIGEYLLDPEGLSIEITMEAGAYPVHATLARYHDQDFDNVATATMVLSGEATVRWEEGSVIAVDGGSTTIVSREGMEVLADTFDRDESAWEEFYDRMFDSQAAHDFLATEFEVDGDLNLAYFSSGVGDGGYPVFVGYDAADQPTRIVVDFLLLHLDWPGWP